MDSMGVSEIYNLGPIIASEFKPDLTILHVDRQQHRRFREGFRGPRRKDRGNEWCTGQCVLNNH